MAKISSFPSHLKQAFALNNSPFLGARRCETRFQFIASRQMLSDSFAGKITEN